MVVLAVVVVAVGVVFAVAVVVVVVEGYCFLINIIVGTSEATRSILHPQIPSVA